MNKFEEILELVRKAEELGYTRNLREIVVLTGTINNEDDYPTILLLTKEWLQLEDRLKISSKFSEVSKEFIYEASMLNEYNGAMYTVWKCMDH